MDMLKKFDNKGQEIYSMPLDSRGWSIALDENRDVWVGTWSNVLRFSPDGTRMQNVMTFPTSSDTYIATAPSVPEPASVLLAAFGFVGFVACARGCWYRAKA
jgi:hypothetical protein